MTDLAVLKIDGKDSGKIKLDSAVFDGKVNEPLLHQAVVTYLANQRKGLASSKTRGDVRGGGKRPWRQKGTGRARVSSIRSPLWRGGGVSFGPHPRSYRKKIPQRMQIHALKSALNAKLRDKELIVVDHLKVNSYKTKDFFKLIKKIKIGGGKTRFVVKSWDKNLKLSSRNIKEIKISLADTLNTYEVLDSRKIIFTKTALSSLEEKIKPWLS